MSDIGNKVCMNHTDREAQGRCIACFKPLCSDCIIRYQGDDYCSDACIEGADQTGKRIDEINTAERRMKRKRFIKKAIILLILCGISYAVYHIISKDKKLSGLIKKKINQAKNGIIEPDDFYHAKDGTWKMETTIHLLKSKKFVSSNTELKQYLIYTVKPGETVRISQAAGRWKKLEVLKNDKITATGWADAEDAEGKLL